MKATACQMCIRDRNNPRLIFAGMYGDLGSSGGSLKNREEFNRMLEDCRQKKIDLIITKSISRFARNLSDAISCIRELQTLNIPVYFEKEHLYSLDSSAEMVFAVLAAIAQEELNHHSRDCLLYTSGERSTSGKYF